jgi:hypothetical protein
MHVAQPALAPANRIERIGTQRLGPFRIVRKRLAEDRLDWRGPGAICAGSKSPGVHSCSAHYSTLRQAHFSRSRCSIFLTEPQAFEISNAVVHENLAVYFVHGTGQGNPTPLTLDQAMSRGAVRIYDDGPLAIENVSGQSVLVQLGDLLKGGLQDQVVGTSFMLPPRSGRVPLGTFCVDPFRSAARQGENPHRFVSVGQFPSRVAKLSMLSGSSDSKAIREIRQSGIWWSIDTLRSRLSDRLGVEMEPPRAAHWPGDDAQNVRANTVLAARRSSWTSSLPLALENRRLVQAQQGYISALNATAVRGADLIGAVFAINGRVEGAEIYQSTALFRQAWPKLLRAYATEAIASAGSATEVLPSPATINNYLTAAQQGQTRDRTAGSDVLSFARARSPFPRRSPAATVVGSIAAIFPSSTSLRRR